LHSFKKGNVGTLEASCMYSIIKLTLFIVLLLWLALKQELSAQEFGINEIKEKTSFIVNINNKK